MQFRIFWLLLLFVACKKSNPVILPQISTISISEVTFNSAKVSGALLSTGNSTITDYGVCYSISPNPTISSSIVSNGTSTTTLSFFSSLLNLTARQTYYVRAYAVNSAGIAYGQELTFTAQQNLTLSQVNTLSVSSITSTSAMINGFLTNTGNTTVTDYGFCWSSSPSPTVSGNKLSSGSSTSAIAFNNTITNLISNQKYYVRAYAVNSIGVAYGQELSFNTLNKTTCILPTVQSGLVSYYPFCGNANDVTSTANHGIVSGAGLTTDRFGNSNSAYSFNGSSNKITVNDNPVLNVSYVTISLWYKTSNTSTEQSLIYKSNWADARNEEYAIVMNYGMPNQIVAGVKRNSSCAPGIGWQKTFANNTTDNTWHHFVFTYDGTSAKIYLDGTLVKTNSISGAMDVCPGGTLTIGAGWSASGVAANPDWFNGIIDDVAIYNRALSASEVLQLYQQ